MAHPTRLAAMATVSASIAWTAVTARWMPPAGRGSVHVEGDRTFYVDCYNSSPASLLDAARAFDRLSRAAAVVAIWLVLICALVSAGNAVSRYTFDLSSNAWLELQWYMFGGTVLLGALGLAAAAGGGGKSGGTPPAPSTDTTAPTPSGVPV